MISKSREVQVRRVAARRGYRLMKSARRDPLAIDFNAGKWPTLSVIASHSAITLIRSPRCSTKSASFSTKSGGAHEDNQVSVCERARWTFEVKHEEVRFISGHGDSRWSASGDYSCKIRLAVRSLAFKHPLYHIARKLSGRSCRQQRPQTRPRLLVAHEPSADRLRRQSASLILPIELT